MAAWATRSSSTSGTSDTLTNRPHLMHFHGVRYRFSSDGAYIPGFSGPGANVKPGETFTGSRLGGARGVWPYHDHSPSDDGVDRGRDVREPLDPGSRRRAAGSRVRRLPVPPRLQHDQRTRLRGQHTGVPSKVGDIVQWDVLSIGDDFHTFHVHGHRWMQGDGTPRDTQVIGPAESSSPLA